jgi:NTP pyrophosphatase (non-canonical NTP hydrolase)
MPQYEIFQNEVATWVEHNFGTIYISHYPYQPLLGMIEEIGELYEVIETLKSKSAIETREILNIVDAIGDIMVYMADYCNCMQFKLEEIAHYSIQDNYSFIVVSGKLCHSHLKYEQNIRGNISEHLFQIKINLARVIMQLHIVCREHGLNFLDCIFRTWDVVKKRDWKKNKENGVVRS